MVESMDAQSCIHNEAQTGPYIVIVEIVLFMKSSTLHWDHVESDSKVFVKLLIKRSKPM